MKLTAVQHSAIEYVDRSPGLNYRYRRQTLEALRRRGLVARYTRYVIRAEWAEGLHVTEQWRAPARNAKPVDEWEITPAGRAALEQSKEK